MPRGVVLRLQIYRERLANLRAGDLNVIGVLRALCLAVVIGVYLVLAVLVIRLITYFQFRAIYQGVTVRTRKLEVNAVLYVFCGSGVRNTDVLLERLPRITLRNTINHLGVLLR